MIHNELIHELKLSPNKNSKQDLSNSLVSGQTEAILYFSVMELLECSLLIEKFIELKQE